MTRTHRTRGAVAALAALLTGTACADPPASPSIGPDAAPSLARVARTSCRLLSVDVWEHAALDRGPSRAILRAGWRAVGDCPGAPLHGRVATITQVVVFGQGGNDALHGSARIDVAFAGGAGATFEGRMEVRCASFIGTDCTGTAAVHAIGPRGAKLVYIDDIIIGLTSGRVTHAPDVVSIVDYIDVDD